MFIEVCQQTVASGYKTKQWIKTEHKWKRVAHKLTDRGQGSRKQNCILFSLSLSSFLPLFSSYSKLSAKLSFYYAQRLKN
jgi:hypothetical protein